MQDKEFTLKPTRQYERCKGKLDRHQMVDLDYILEELERRPHPPLVKELKGKLSGRHTVRFSNQSYRLVIKINWNDKIITLLYLAARAVVYNGKMW